MTGRTGRWAAIAAGGALGAAVRWAVTAPGDGGGFPTRTLAVNVVGCLVLGGLLAARSAGRGLPVAWDDGAGVGFCGGLTTFSTLAVEVTTLADGGRAAMAAAYVAASVAAGLAAFLAGDLATRRALARRAPADRTLPRRAADRSAADRHAAGGHGRG